MDNGLKNAMARLGLILVSLIIVVSLCACSDNDDNTAIDDIEDNDASPKQDALTVNVSNENIYLQC